MMALVNQNLYYYYYYYHYILMCYIHCCCKGSSDRHGRPILVVHHSEEKLISVSASKLVDLMEYLVTPLHNDQQLHRYLAVLADLRTYSKQGIEILVTLLDQFQVSQLTIIK